MGALDRLIATSVPPDKVAAVLVEPVQGEGGVVVPPPGFLARLKDFCRSIGALLILDEIQTGFGRAGGLFAFQGESVEPDILVTSKAIGGGMPIAATVIRNGILPEALIDDQWQIFTFGGHAVSCAAGAATIDFVNEENLPEKAARQGDRLDKRLNEMMAKYKSIGDVRTMGLFIGVEIVKDKATKEPWNEGAGNIFGLALNKGALFGTNGARGNGNIIKLKPPLIITDAEADKALDILEESIAENEKSL